MSDEPKPIERTITIEYRDSNFWTVRVGDRYAEGLTWDEMLGQIAHMTCPRKADEFLFGMRTQAEWDALHPTKPELKPHEKLLTP